MAEADWDTVTYLRKKQVNSTTLKSASAVKSAQRQGLEVETTKKFSASQNRQHTANKDTARLDRETEELHHDHVEMSVSKLIQQKRAEVGLSQKELATKINEKPQVINEYESGKAIPNQQVLTKIERCLGVKLRGKDKGQPLFKKKK